MSSSDDPGLPHEFPEHSPYYGRSTYCQGFQVWPLTVHSGKNGQEEKTIDFVPHVSPRPRSPPPSPQKEAPEPRDTAAAPAPAASVSAAPAAGSRKDAPVAVPVGLRSPRGSVGRRVDNRDRPAAGAAGRRSGYETPQGPSDQAAGFHRPQRLQIGPSDPPGDRAVSSTPRTNNRTVPTSPPVVERSPQPPSGRQTLPAAGKSSEPPKAANWPKTGCGRPRSWSPVAEGRAPSPRECAQALFGS